ncbi:MAG: hypothetical protein D6718_13575, partial [Acidobacteria bacterium]
MLDALVRAEGNRKRAAEILGIGRATLYRWIDRCGLATAGSGPVGGRYEPIRPLEAGPGFEIHLARDRLGRYEGIAIRLEEEGSWGDADPAAVARVRDALREARHPSLARVLDLGIDPGSSRPFLLFRWTDARPLGEDPALSPAELAQLFEQALRALDALHRKGLVHGGLGPGALRVVSEAGAIRAWLTPPAAGAVLSGQPPAWASAAPEARKGAAPSARGDLFALAALFAAPLDRAGGGAEAEELRRLVRRCGASDPTARPADAGAALEELESSRGVRRGPAVWPGVPRFTGRDAELAVALERIDPRRKLREGTAPALVVVGEAGIGRSRFLAVCAERLEERGVRVAAAACHPEGGLAPIAELLRAALGDGLPLRTREALLRRYATALRAAAPDLLEAGPENGSRPPASRFQMLDGVASALADAADAAPLVLAIDDLQHADPLVLDLFWHLARLARRAPLRLLASALKPGDGELPPALASMLEGAGAEGLAGLLPLGPLSREAVFALAQQVLGPALTAAVRERLWESSRGHPSFLVELLRELLERGATAPLEGIRLPATARELLRARLERLDSASRALLEALVLAGRPASEEELGEIAGRPPGADLETLEKRGLICRADGGRWRPALEILREVLLEELPAETRRRWHRRWADRLAGVPGSEAERARHLVAAGAGPECREELVAAADTLISGFQPRAAIPLLEAALDRCPPSSREAIEVCRRLEAAARHAIDRERAARACERWAEIAERLGDKASEARAMSFLAASLRVLCRWDAALDAARRALRLAEASGEEREIALAAKTLALTLWMSWSHREAVAPMRRSMELARRARNKLGQARTLNDIAYPIAMTGRVYEGLTASETAREMFREVRDEPWVWLSYVNEALTVSALGALDETIERQKRVIEGLREVQPDVSFDVLYENLALALLRAGRYSEALEAGQRQLDAATRLGRHTYRVSALLAIGHALYRLGNDRAAREHDRLAAQLARAVEEESQALYAGLARVRDLRAAGRLDAAEEEARALFERAAGRRAKKQGITAALELAKIARRRGRPDEAHRWLDEAEAALDERWEEMEATRAELLLERGRAWSATGRFEFVIPQLDIGLALARHHGPREAQIALAAELAEAWQRAGDEERAQAALAEAAETIERVAASLDPGEHRDGFLRRPDIARVRELARRRGAAGPRAGAAGTSSILAALDAFAREAAAGHPVEALLEAALDAVRAVAGVRRAAVLLRGREGEWRAAAAAGFEEGADPLAAAPRELLERLAEERPEQEADARAADLGLFPLRADGACLGALHVGTGDAGPGIPERRALRAVAAQLASGLARARLAGELERRAEELREARPDRWRFGELIGRSEPMQRVFALLEKVAPADVPVLVLGESGTGKELAARALHAHSPRAEAPFLSENCAAIPASLLESALFGHVKGAFTGADADKKGLFELAEGGTLLLDEIGDMSFELQAKLLRVLQEREIRPVGSERTIPIDVRVVAATHRDLAQLVNEGRFRQDLFFRLNGITVRLPPLRERKEDIPLLLRHFLERECASRGLAVPEVEPVVLRALARHDWPGNVRELQNTVRRLLLLAEGDRIGRREMDADPD